MNRNLLSGIAIGVFAGFLAGYFLGASHSNDEVTVAAAPAATAPMGGAIPMGKPNPMEIQERIAATEQLVAADPKNERAWINLGNDYFDTHQHQKSVDAYGKALALNPRNPDVLTDQGIMYRELKAFDKAVACFKQPARSTPGICRACSISGSSTPKI